MLIRKQTSIFMWHSTEKCVLGYTLQRNLMLSRSNWAHVESVDIIIGANIVCHGDWSMVSPPTCQEVIDVTSTRPLSKDFDVKRFGLNTTSRIKAFVFRFVSIPAKRIRTSNANAIIHSSFFIYSIIWGKDSENLRTSQI